MNVFKENKAAIYFLLVFVGLYLILNTAYGLYVEWYSPQPDPITLLVSKQVAGFLTLWDASVVAVPIDASKNVSIRNGYRTVINVFEGCNGINVMIVFISFLVAFRGKLKATILFALMGFFIIYLMNIARVSLLYAVEIYWPRYLYLFHKYLFTGMIYAVVFALWYLWVKQVKRAAN